MTTKSRAMADRSIRRQSAWLRVWTGIAALLAGAASPAPPLFDPADQARLDAALTQAMTAKQLPSVLVDIARPGAAPYRFVRGPAVQGGGPRTPDQPFRIASITKTFTATAILLLADRGKLAVSDPIGRWFPDFPNASLITVDDLLRMRSGIAAASDEALGRAAFDHPLAPAPTLVRQMAEAAEHRNDFKPPDQPGRGRYVNLNYEILGGIIEKVSGQDVGAFIEANIVDRLGLGQTAYPAGDRLPGGLHGYGRDQAGVLRDKTRFNPAIAGAAGAMISSATDLRRWARALCTGELLAPATQAARMQGQPLADSSVLYGQGLITGPAACGHSGSVPGFSTDLYYFPAFDATVITSVNRLDRDDVLQTPPLLEAAYDALQARLQPAAYCRKVGTDPALHTITDALRPGVERAFGVSGEAARGSWRCDGGTVLACIAGANLPCGRMSMATTIPAADQWCRSHPGGVPPAFVTGHDTAWRWRCDGRRAERGEAAWTLNPAGFARELWKPI